MARQGDVSDVTSESSDSTGYSSDEDRDPSRSSSQRTPMIVVSNRCGSCESLTHKTRLFLNISNISQAALCTEEDRGRKLGSAVKVCHLSFNIK